MNICPNCGKEVDENARHCGHCGHKLQIEQKKTMLGMAAIDPAELRAHLARARDTADAADAASTGAPASSPEMAPTEVMASISAPAESGVESESAEPGFEDEVDAATGPTQAMSALTEPAPAIESPAITTPGGDVAAQATGPMEALQTPESSASPAAADGREAVEEADPLAATEMELPAVDLKRPAEQPATAAAEGDVPPVSTPEPLASASEPLASELGEASEQGLASTLPDNLAQLTADPENKKRLLLFLGAAAALLLGCCILGSALAFFL
ncbi:hypothetical protein DL240_09885 [Lujinxingia litoralis]|uniref:Zinc-ribbon domain-containing protein n=1 Tax=Lujinxingia litoralis TaxID=2211119 RepID=A0A328C571_9DELT|nr:zinc-ribbon domain-containing protein [Lujinxingia litoralis]RAL22156.1 hypothetical protein DL240_09885 [Lujinxingia litoralis]